MNRSLPPPPPPSKQDEFARHGFQEGYPLWNPDPVLLPPDRQNKGLEIGDIGTVDEDGCFHTVLNVYRSPNPTSLAGEPDIYVSETFETGHIFSSPETSWRIEESGASYYTGPGTANHGRVITQYLSSLSEDGAHIIVPQGAKYFKLGPRDKSVLQSLAADPLFRTLWFDTASNHLGSRPKTLYLITGLCRTRSWSLASFGRKNDQKERVCCELVEEDGKLQVGRAGSHWTPRGRFAYKIGPPIERQGNDNQTIFIQSYTITHRDNVKPPSQKQLATAVTRGMPGGSGRGAPTVQISNRGMSNIRLISSDRRSGTSGKGMNSTAIMLATESTAVVQHIPTTSPGFHPSEIINRYLLAKQSSASAAVTHDSLWISMLAKEQLSNLQELETTLDALVTKSYLIILSNGVVYLKNNPSSLRRFGIGSPIDLTDCVKQGNQVPSSRNIFGDIYQSTLQAPQGAIRVETMIIKTGGITADGSTHYEQQKQVRRMIEVWSELDHTNVLPLIWTAEVHDRLYVVFPWTENGSLTSYLNATHSKLTERRILILIIDVISGLQYLHSKCNIHNGLSGSNISVNEQGRALLSGYVTAVDDSVVTRPFAVKEPETDLVRWAAPESLGLWFKGKPLMCVSTEQSNIYSLGAIILQILSGMVPYHYYSRSVEIVSAIYTQKIPQRPYTSHLTDRRWEFIKLCWSPLGSRPSTEKALEFHMQELKHLKETRQTPRTGTKSVPSGKPAGDKLPITVSLTQDSGPPPSGIPPLGRLPATRLSGLPFPPVSGPSPVSLPPSGVPATRFSGALATKAGTTSLPPGGFSAARISGPPARMGSAKPLPSEQKGPDAPLKGKYK